MMRVRYTVRRKLGLLASAKRIMEEEVVSLQEDAGGGWSKNGPSLYVD
jgi:hypothetical protein